VTVNFKDLPLNVLFNLIEYTARADGESLDRIKNGKGLGGGKMGVEGLLKAGKMRG